MFYKGGAVMAFISCLLISAIAYAEEPGPSSKELAVVGSSVITEQFFMSEMSRRGQHIPGSFSTIEQKNALLEEMIRSEMLYHEARKEGYDWKPEVRAALKRIVISKYREDMLEPELAKITVNDSEIEAYYQGHSDKLVTPRLVRAAVIQVSVPMKSTEAQKNEGLKKAEEAREHALLADPSVASFGEAAIRYSDDQTTRYRGGDSGFLRQDDTGSRWDKEVLDAIFLLKEKGEVSQVITAPSGYFVVKLMDIKESMTRHLAEIKEMIRYQVLREKKDRIEQDFFGRLASKSDVRINSDLLMGIEPPGARTRLEPPSLPER